MVARPRGVRSDLLSTWTILVLVAASCGGIGDPSDPNHCHDTYCVGGEQTGVFSMPPRLALDMLLVVDDRVDARPEGVRLEEVLESVMEEFQTEKDLGYRGVDVNIAVVPASGDSGPTTALWPTGTPCSPIAGSFLRATSICDDASNYSGALSEAVTCAVSHLPASGEAPRPIDTVRAVLDPGGPGITSGFRRSGQAYLFIGIVSTEDDPTLVDANALDAAREAIASAAQRPDEEIMVGVVAPGSAAGLAAFAESYGLNGGFSDVTDEYWGALDYGGHMLASRTQSACLDWPVVDARPDLEGLQPDCIATEIHVFVDDGGTVVSRIEEILPACPDNAPSSGHCWRVEENVNRCAPGYFDFVVEPARPACWPSYAVRYAFTCATRYE